MSYYNSPIPFPNDIAPYSVNLQPLNKINKLKFILFKEFFISIHKIKIEIFKSY
jgi:hypothetical protein